MSTFSEAYEAVTSRRRERKSIMVVLGRSLGKLRNLRTAGMATSGFGLLTSGAWVGLGMAWGLGAAGLSVLILEALGGGDDK